MRPSQADGEVAASWFGWGADAFWKACVLWAPVFLSTAAVAQAVRAPDTVLETLTAAPAPLLATLVVAAYGTAAAALNWRNRIFTEAGTLEIRRGVLPWVGYQRRSLSRRDLRRAYVEDRFDSPMEDTTTGSDSIWRVRLEATDGRDVSITAWSRDEAGPKRLVDALETWRTAS